MIDREGDGVRIGREAAFFDEPSRWEVVGDEGSKSGGRNGLSGPVCGWRRNVGAGEQSGDEPSAHLGGLLVFIEGV